MQRLRSVQQTFVLVLSGVVLLGFCLRLYKLTNPVADWHSFRQADTASVTREYVKHGVDLLHPKYQDLSNIQSGENNDEKDNVEGWRMVEFPIVNGALALLLRAVPSLDLVITSRLASIVASLCSIVFLALITKRVYGRRVALLTALFFAVLPYSVYYSRVILPEPFLVALVLASLWTYQTYVMKKNWVWLAASSILFAVALLVKPMAVFFVPVFLGIRYRKELRVRAMDVLTGVCFALATLPLLWWRRWIVQYPLGIPISDWLYNGVGKGTNLLPVYKIRFRPAWWRWIFYERLTKLFLGYAGIVLFGIGALWRIVKKDLFFISWAVGAFAYVTVFAAGNVQHDYYQILLVPFVVITLALGCVGLYDLLKKNLPWRVSASIVAGVVLLMLALSWQRVSGYYQVNNWAIVEAGQAADRLLPKDALVIAPYTGDTAFLFQTNRRGWPIGGDLATKIKEGAQYYVSVNYDDETNALMKKYPVIVKNKDFVIIDLRTILSK